MRRFHERMRDLFVNGRRAIMRRSVTWLLTMGLFTIGTALTLGMGAYLYVVGAITIGLSYFPPRISAVISIMPTSTRRRGRS